MSNLVTFLITLGIFLVAIVSCKFAPKEYPVIHKRFPYISIGFNIPFFDFTEKNWPYAKKMGVRLFSLAALLHTVISIILYFILTEGDLKVSLMLSASFFLVSAIIVLIKKIDKYDEGETK